MLIEVRGGIVIEDAVLILKIGGIGDDGDVVHRVSVVIDRIEIGLPHFWLMLEVGDRTIEAFADLVA